MPLKANKTWSQERCSRKVGETLGPLEDYVRRHLRWTVRLVIAFIVNVCLISPFFAGMPWHSYWRSVGNPLLLLCLVIFLALVFEAGWTFTHWQALRDFRRAEWSYLKATRKVEPEKH